MRRIIKIVKKPFAEEILVLGDSHVAAFNFFSPLQLSTVHVKYQYNVCSVGGATAYGLKNKNSKTQTSQKFAEYIKVFKGKKLFIMLGEVDTGFVIWLKHQTDKQPVDKYLEISLNNYLELLESLSNRFDIYVFSAPLPTLQDNVTVGEVAIKRAEIKVSQQDRTKLTLKFNKKIAQYCVTMNNINYIDLDSESLAPNGLVIKALLNKDPTDHHYDMSSFCKILTYKIRSI